METFVINLESSKKRLKLISLQLHSLQISFKVIKAVDGKNLPSNYTNFYSQDKNKNEYYKPLSNGEIACVLSHKLALETFLKSNEKHLLLLEDDALIDSKIKSFIDQALNTPNWDLIKLYTGKKPKHLKNKIRLSNELELGLPKKIPNSNLGQLITRAGATKILKYYEQFYQPADISLQAWWEHDLRVLMCSPNLVEPTDVDSDINSSVHRKEISYKKLDRLLWKVNFELKRILKSCNKDAFYYYIKK